VQTSKLPGIDFFEVIVELVVARSANEREVIDGGHAGYLFDLLSGSRCLSDNGFFEARKVNNDQQHNGREGRLKDKLRMSGRSLVGERRSGIFAGNRASILLLSACNEPGAWIPQQPAAPPSRTNIPFYSQYASLYLA